MDILKRAFVVMFLMFFGYAPVFAEDLKIDAGNGISWLPEHKHYHATGRVRIIRGEATSWSDQARAYYDDNPELISRIELEGHVRYLRGSLEIEGDFADIIPDSEDVLVTGKQPRLENGATVITASKSLQYQGKNQVVFARGDALLVDGLNKIAAQKMKGLLRLDEDSGKQVLSEAYFDGEVRGNDGSLNPESKLYIEGDRGLYHADEEWMRVCGNSRILRGADIMRGECAHYDLISENFRFLNEGTLETPLPPVILPSKNPKIPQEKPNPSEKRTRMILKTKN